MTANDFILALARVGIAPTTERVQSLKAWHLLDNTDATHENADDFIFEQATKMLAEANEVSVDVLLSSSRKRELVEARNILAFILKKATRLSLKSIGGKMGGRDHSTVIHNVATFADLWETDPGFRKKASSILNHFNIKP